MPDNVTVGGRTIAADEVVVEGLTVLVPRDKVGFGAAGSYGDVEAANPLPVTAKNTALASNTPARVASSATVVTLAASNANRRALKVFNESTAILYVKDGATASVTDYSVQVPAGGYYEWPLPIYTGIVTGLWAAANGAAQVTEGV